MIVFDILFSWNKYHITLTRTSVVQPQVLMSGKHFSGQCLGEWSSPLRSVKVLYVVSMLCLNINTLHFEKQIWLGKLLKYLKSGLLKLLPRSTLRQKLYAVRGRNCISVLMPVNTVCCCHLLPPGCRCWCLSAWWHGSFVGISADGLWQGWQKREKKKESYFFEYNWFFWRPLNTLMAYWMFTIKCLICYFVFY